MKQKLILFLGAMLIGFIPQEMAARFSFNTIQSSVSSFYNAAHTYSNEHPKSLLAGLVASAAVVGAGTYFLHKMWFKKKIILTPPYIRSPFALIKPTSLINQTSRYKPTDVVDNAEYQRYRSMQKQSTQQTIGVQTYDDAMPFSDTDHSDTDHSSSEAEVEGSSSGEIIYTDPKSTDPESDEDNSTSITYKDFSSPTFAVLQKTGKNLSREIGLFLDCWPLEGYVHLRSSSMVPHYEICFLKNYHNDLLKRRNALPERQIYSDYNLLAMKNRVLGNYKIHLMPQTQYDLMIIIKRILCEAQMNRDFAAHLFELKFLPDLIFDGTLEQQLKAKSKTNDILPLIVIYPALGKDNAQYVLDTLYKLFKDMPGLDITPRYNRRVTSLIYYSQGNGEDKGSGNWDEHFNSDKTLYLPEAFEEDIRTDYSLIIQ